MTVHKICMIKKIPLNKKLKKPTVMVSGGFDPVHAGHIRMIRDAANFGDVIVIANSDQWLFRKKGFVFMTFEQRAEILNAIKGVILVDSVDDSDGTVCEAIRRLKPDFLLMEVIAAARIPQNKQCAKN
jgi:cytidyltransferase-like protein